MQYNGYTGEIGTVKNKSGFISECSTQRLELWSTTVWAALYYGGLASLTSWDVAWS